MKHQEDHRNIITIITALVLGILSCWDTWEQDIFWQIRAGLEFWRDFTFSSTETWSYSVQGHAWHNFQWLSNLLLFGVFNEFGVPGLIVSRGLLTFAIFFQLSRHILKNTSGNWAWNIALIALIYISIHHRIQIRSELIVLTLFATYVTFTGRGQFFLRFVICLLTANLHPGLLPFFLLWSLCTHLSWPFKLKSLWQPIALGCTIFLSPYGLKTASFLVEHIFYYQSRILGNPEHRTISPLHFDIEISGLLGYSWLLITILFSTIILANSRKNKGLVGLATLISFTLMAIYRDRAIPFQILAILPYAIPYLGEAHDVLRKRALPLLSIVATILLIWHITLFPFRYQFIVSPEVFPIEETELLNKITISGNLMHTPSYGSYLLTFAPKYKVFIDTRETPFLSLQDTFRKATIDPVEMQRTLESFEVGAVIWPAPLPTLDDSGELANIITNYFPKERWALVHFGIRTMLLIKRPLELQNFVEEYRELSPSLPPHTMLNVGVDELRRCLASNAPHILCILLADIRGVPHKKRKLYPSDEQYLIRIRDYYSDSNLNTRDQFLKTIDGMMR